MSKPYKAALVVMRAQMFHNGHVQLLEDAIKLADTVVVYIGSSNKPRSLKNPFTFSERAGVIHDWYKNDATGKCDVMFSTTSLPDYDYEDMVWEQCFWDSICDLKEHLNVDSEEIVLLTSGKDSDFEERQSYVSGEPISVAASDPVTFEGGYSSLSATSLRRMWLNSDFQDLFKYVPRATKDFLETEQGLKLAYEMRKESYHVLDARRPYLELEYEPLFQTGDCMVLNTHGKVLLVQRKEGTYGAGQWALAGGYVHADESILEGASRELLEETGIDVEHLTPLHSQTFDKPDRDPRGRMITTCYLYQLEEDVIVTPSDDVSDYKWVSRRELNGEEMFLDHLGIINTMFREICT